MDVDRIRRIGTAAAYNAAKVLWSRFGNIDHVEKKGRIDLVTEADIAAEKAIVDTLRVGFPDVGILAEESGASGDNGKGSWVIDPLDGTTNYAHRLGFFAVSLAFVVDGVPEVGIVLNPVSDELFCAVARQGAWRNGNPISVSSTKSMEDSLLVTGFPYNVRDILPETTQRFARVLNRSQGVRRLGSAALDLCYVADGRFEAFWEQNLKPWDTAAGWLMVAEAGGRVTDFSGGAYDLGCPEILASNGSVHPDMQHLLTLEEDDS
ncbi:MAG: inositol monophosphatase [Desulfobacteraceae bacterium]|jgi:myo-inositol-1(or 4)-monophosphatase|nr:inositol monophosphatase [Desulfobacteraceae bacterium]